MSVAAPIINGNRYSFASITVRLRGLPVFALKSINYGSELVPGEVYNADGIKVGRTPGVRKHTCEFEILRGEWQELREALGQSYGLTPFHIEVTWAEDGEGTYQDVILDARIEKDDANNAEGSDAASVSVVCNVMDIRHGTNNLSIYAPYDMEVVA